MSVMDKRFRYWNSAKQRLAYVDVVSHPPRVELIVAGVHHPVTDEDLRDAIIAVAYTCKSLGGDDAEPEVGVVLDLVRTVFPTLLGWVSLGQVDMGCEDWSYRQAQYGE